MEVVSRLATQWEESINVAMFEMEKHAERRLYDLLRTVEHLLEAGSGDRVPEIQADLDRLSEIRDGVRQQCLSALL
jgi:hypothetical protein